MSDKVKLLIVRAEILALRIRNLRLVTSSSIAEFIIRSASMLAIVINKNVNKTKTSFLTW